MVISMPFTLSSYRTWNHEIFAAIQRFMYRHQVPPQIILTNERTGQRIDVAMSAELIEEGKVDQLKEIGVFSCRLADLEFCLDNTLAERHCLLVYDDDAEFVDRDELEEESSRKPRAA